MLSFSGKSVVHSRLFQTGTSVNAAPAPYRRHCASERLAPESMDDRVPREGEEDDGA
jgi:hypothetical protein